MLSVSAGRGGAGAYAVITDDSERIALVEANGGRLYLPGGRLEPGETPRQAMIREILEECGWHARVLGPVGTADQPIFGGDQTIRAHYFRAAVERTGRGCGEHRTLWLPPSEASARVHRRGDAWAIGRVLASWRHLSPQLEFAH